MEEVLPGKELQGVGVLLEKLNLVLRVVLELLPGGLPRQGALPVQILRFLVDLEGTGLVFFLYRRLENREVFGQVYEPVETQISVDEVLGGHEVKISLGLLEPLAVESEDEFQINDDALLNPGLQLTL